VSPSKNYRCRLNFLGEGPSSIQLFCDPLQILLNYVLICLRGNPLLGIRPRYWKLHRVGRISSMYIFMCMCLFVCVREREREKESFIYIYIYRKYKYTFSTASNNVTGRSFFSFSPLDTYVSVNMISQVEFTF